MNKLFNLEECCEQSLRIGEGEFPFKVKAYWGKINIILEVDYNLREEKWYALKYRKSIKEPWINLNKIIKNPEYKEYEFFLEKNNDCEFCNQNYNMIFCNRCKDSFCPFCYVNIHKCNFS